MSPNTTLTLKEGALLICDAHYSEQRPQLLELLKGIESGEIAATQLILLGDIFDLLLGPVPLTRKRNSEAIKTINAIAKKIEVIFFEGNHDFLLKGIFENVRIVPIVQQPLRAEYQGKKLFLAHGDILAGKGYALYTAMIRNPLLLRLLRWIDQFSNHGIIRRLDSYLSKKDDCQEFENFEAYTHRRLSALECRDIDYFIEGHYHQNRAFKVGSFTYLNPAAFACNQRYFVVQSATQQELLKELAMGKETGC